MPDRKCFVLFASRQMPVNGASRPTAAARCLNTILPAAVRCLVGHFLPGRSRNFLFKS